MRYVGDIYRPPSEAYSLLVQVTIGCAHNKCTFCNMYKEKQFRVRNVDEVLEDLDWARAQYRRVERIFLCDGDALCLANHKLLKILDYIAEKFPECERVTTYGRAKDALRKTEEELRELRAHGLQMVYMGAESGSQRVLDMIKKGETREELIAGVQRLEAAGIQTSVTFISGLAGPELWQEHAIESGTTCLLLQHARPSKPCVFRSNHASNYVSLRGNMPMDNESMILSLKKCMEDRGLLKDERFRML